MKTQQTTASAKKSASKSEEMPADNSMLHDFFKDELKDIYWAEKHLVKTLPKMKKAATSEELQNAFTDHLETTKEHVSRLEKVFELLGEQRKGHPPVM